MKTVFLYTSLGFFLSAILARVQGQTPLLPRYKISINDNWQFVKGEKPAEDSVEWQSVYLPHSWNTEDPFDEEPGYYRGVGWYRKVVNLNTFPQKEKAFLYFEAANQYARVFVNGERVGEHKGGYTAFCFDITSQLREGDNLLEVRLDNSHDPAVPPLKGDFNFYGGIYRDVYLILTGAIHFDLLDYACPGVYISTPAVDSAMAKIRVRGTILNEGAPVENGRLSIEIRDQGGAKKGIYERVVQLGSGPNNFDWAFSFPGPELWSPHDPHLYSMAIQVVDGSQGQVFDEIVQPLAFRWFDFDSDEGFFLNGKPLKLIGVNRHQDLPGKANALSNAEHISDMEMIQSMGANFFRTAHYPQDPAVMDACARLGLVVSMEIPLDHDITDSPEFYSNCKTMMREMIRQYYNYPSIVIWAYMNEMFLGRSLEKDREQIGKIVGFARELEALTREEDPTRFTMIPNHGDFDVYHKSGLTRIPMIVGWNLYYGWYEAGMEGFGAFMDRAHRELPDKPLILTEYGAGADPRLRSLEPARFDFSVDWENAFHQSHLKQISERPFIAGAAVWNMFDFGSENRRDAVPRINNKGLCGFNRQPKDAFYLYQAWLSDEPTLKLAPAGWRRRAGVQNLTQPLCVQTVRAYGNVEKAELLHNGRPLGEKALEEHTASWKVPFQDGENRLELRATVDGQPVGDAQLVNFEVLPEYSLAGRQSLHMNMGASLFFQDEDGGLLWLPERESRENSWGFIGGRRFMPRNRGVGTDHDILGTDKGPLYQTQRIGLQRLLLPLSEGAYRLTLHFAELERKEPGERAFGLAFNGKELIHSLDISKDYGLYRAVALSFSIQLNEPMLSLDFIPRQGEPVINAIEIQKIGY
ncbi:MAG: DUF4982 domain-containing protein [Phaeodactylibacter sp.]|nr:DUF4982 domain-containing protein [Phaeodactylibacter sp.]